MRNMKTVPYEGMFTLSAPSPKWVWNAQGQLVEVPAGQPAFDHDPVTGQSLGQRVEAVEATNTLPYSEDFSQWLRGSNVTVLPENDPRMGACYRISVSGEDTQGIIAASVLTDLTKTHMRAALVKGVGSAWIGTRSVDNLGFGIRIDLTTGEISGDGSGRLIDSKSVYVGDGWWLFITVWDPDYSATHNNFGIYCDAGESALIKFAQAEYSATMGSYISTTGSAVTRSADLLDAGTIHPGVDRGSILVRCQLTEGAPVLSFDGTALVAAPDADWHTYVISYDDTETLISIDGADATTGAGITPSLPLNVFRDSSSAGNGYIEDLVFSPIKKTAAQVKAASAAGEL